MKFKVYLKESSKKDIIKRFKKLKKKSLDELVEIAGTNYTITEASTLINIILFEEFREEDIELALNNKELK